MSAAADALQRDPKRKVLAIYPARALIQDQAAKWKEMLGTLGFSSSIIDGGVQVDQRIGRLKDNHVILMTPDVLSRFHAQQTPLGTGPLQGMCIFDSTHGSLRLTEKLAVNFPEIVEMALQIVKEQEHGPRTDPLSWMASSG